MGRPREHFSQFRAIDEATRFRVLRIHDESNIRSALYFLDHLRRSLAFAIHRIWTDRYSSFGRQVTRHLTELRIGCQRIPPASPKRNGKVEASHKTDEEEFYRGQRFRTRKEVARMGDGGEACVPGQFNRRGTPVRDRAIGEINSCSRHAGGA